MRLTSIRRAYFWAGAAAISSGAGGEACADQIHRAYTIAAGANSIAFAIPISNSPVILSCAQTTPGDVGTGQVTLIRSTTDNGLIFNGYDISGIITNGQGDIASHIVYCDFFKKVDLQVSNTLNIKVVNGDTVSRTVEVMFTY